MRGLTSTLVLGVSLVGLVAYIYFVESKRDPAAENANPKAFAELTADTIEEVVTAADLLAKDRKGALLVIEREPEVVLDRMERLVKDLLRLARLESGQDTVDATRMSIAGLLASVEHDLESTLVARHQSIAVHGEPSSPSFMGDFAKLSDALRNIVENACHYGPEGRPIDVTVQANGAELTITVADPTRALIATSEAEVARGVAAAATAGKWVRQST